MLKLTESLLISCKSLEDSVRIFLRLGDYFNRAEVLIATAMEFKLSDASIKKL